MRPVPLSQRPVDASALARWCADMIGNLCRASQIDTPANAQNFLTPVALEDAAPIAFDWAKAGSFAVTITASRQLAVPTNPRPGEWRFINVKANSGTARTLTFASGYGSGKPTLTDITATKNYLLKIYCVSATLFIVEATNSSP